MSKINTILSGAILIVLIACISCQEDYISDPLDPRLIMYTETGVDASGAMFNDKLWTSVVNMDYLFGGISREPKLWSYASHDSIILRFDGSMKDAPNTGYNIEFHLGGISVNHISDLVALNQTHILIDGTQNVCHVTDYTNGVPASEVTGHLYFRKVTPETMSGTFYIKIGDFMEISYGRFDYHLSVIDLDIR